MPARVCFVPILALAVSRAAPGAPVPAWWNRVVYVLVGCVFMTLSGAAVDSGPSDPAAAALEQLRAAGQTRTDLAREESAWTLERSRLLALIEATAAETARLEREAGSAEAVRDAARTRLSALGSGSDLEAVRNRLGEAGTVLSSTLAVVARGLPPGAVPALGEASGEGRFDAVVRALEAAERAAGSVAVEVVTGDRDGRPQAVKMLRIAGAAAWWVALDGSAAGVVEIHDGAVRLRAADADEAAAIAGALAQAEGRQPPAVVLLPLPLATAGGQP